MQSDVVYVSVPGTREDVLHLMAEKQMNEVPVVKKGTKKLVGVVARSDLLRKADEDQLAMLMNRDLITVTPRSDIKTAAKLMLEKKCRRLPVVDDEDLVGMISVPDVLGAMLENREEFQNTDIRGLVKRRVFSVWDQTPLPLAYMIMEMAGQNALIVLNAEGGVTGMISVSDFLRLSEITVEDNVSKTYSGTDTTVEWGWTSKDFLVVTKKLLKMPSMPVEKIETKNVISVSELTTISECVRILRKNDIDQAPVLSATGSLVGMIEDMDLLTLVQETA
jgi:CBS domain-containing protein